ncbi:MAG TPA: peroxidase [Acidimicrobiia bacterium]|nr:peroxidase [Acidimicrobiia bacterium]
MDRFAADWRTAGLDAPTEALLDYVDRLTRAPASVGAADVQHLRSFGLSDRAITDAVQVCSFFNYINRIAEGLGVDPEPWLDEAGRPRP